MSTEFYELIGVDRGASGARIRQAYGQAVSRLARRRRALSDQGADTSALDLQRSRLDEAWAVLQDPIRRRRYDAMLQWSEGGRSNGGRSAEAMWAQVSDALVHPAAALAAKVLRVTSRLGEIGQLPLAPSGAEEEPPTLVPHDDDLTTPRAARLGRAASTLPPDQLTPNPVEHRSSPSPRLRPPQVGAQPRPAGGGAATAPGSAGPGPAARVAPPEAVRERPSVGASGADRPPPRQDPPSSPRPAAPEGPRSETTASRLAMPRPGPQRASPATLPPSSFHDEPPPPRDPVSSGVSASRAPTASPASAGPAARSRPASVLVDRASSPGANASSAPRAVVLPRVHPLSPEVVSALADQVGYGGTFLATVRERLGLSVRDLADHTRISVRCLEALESEARDQLPSATFVRGYVREVARTLQLLDADAVVAGYMRRYEGR